MAKSKQIILRPLFTEKITLLTESERKYAFEVAPDANKMEIKDAIEKKFDVKITKVATMNMMGKQKSMTVRSGGKVIRTFGRRKHWKKAVVTLGEGYAIDLYQGEDIVE